MPYIENHEWDTADFAAIGLAMVPILTYITILTKQHRMLCRSTYRVQVLSTRTVLFLPTYTVLVWLMLVFPGLAAALEIPVSIAEGVYVCVAADETFPLTAWVHILCSMLILWVSSYACKQPRRHR